MKTLIGMLVLGVVAYLVWQRSAGSGPESMEDPVYGEVRVDLNVKGREIDMALFVRTPNRQECSTRTDRDWSEVFEECPACELHPVQCRDELPARYARLFDDEAIPSWYLSMNPGIRGEREGRLVVYGLTDQEGEALCAQVREVVLKKYHGTAECVAPSG